MSDPSAPPEGNVHAIRAVLDERLISELIASHIGRRPVRLEQRPTKAPRYVYEAFFGDGGSVVFKAEHDTHGDDAIVLEWWAMDRVREIGVPAPEVLARDWSAAAFPGRYGHAANHGHHRLRRPRIGRSGVGSRRIRAVGWRGRPAVTARRVCARCGAGRVVRARPDVSARRCVAAGRRAHTVGRLADAASVAAQVRALLLEWG